MKYHLPKTVLPGDCFGKFLSQINSEIKISRVRLIRNQLVHNALRSQSAVLLNQTKLRQSQNLSDREKAARAEFTPLLAKSIVIAHR